MSEPAESTTPVTPRDVERMATFTDAVVAIALTPEFGQALVRTAREGGESVVSIAKRFGIHRATVWEHTKA